MITSVPYYGLHTEGSVSWLVQGRKGNNFVGIKAECPFTVSGGMCNHLIPAAAPIPDPVHWARFMEIFYDPLVQAMLPVPPAPGKHMFFVEDPEDSLALYLTSLARLSSPIVSTIKRLWSLKAKDVEKDLQTSNIQPLVLVQASPRTQVLLDVIAQVGIYFPRPVVITGASEMVVRPPIQRITTKLRDQDIAELMMLPLESIGAFLLRRYARREPLDGPMESREARRDRMIKDRNTFNP